MTVVSVLTYKSVDHMISDGGSQAWRADRRKLRMARYLVTARHQHSPHGREGDEEHKHAFLVARIDGITDADTDGEAHNPSLPPRNKIQFSDYALVNGPLLPLSGQNPVQYWESLADLGIDEAHLSWRSVQKAVDMSPMEHAKHLVAQAHGVQPEQIEITIRF